MPSTTPRSIESAQPLEPAASPVGSSSDPLTRGALDLDLERIILAAAEGNVLSASLLKPAIHRIARSTTISVDETERVVDAVIASFADPVSGPGKPRAGNAVAWLENVTRFFAKHDFDLETFAPWTDWGEEEDPERDNDG
jgi:hypothetical protein